MAWFRVRLQPTLAALSVWVQTDPREWISGTGEYPIRTPALWRVRYMKAKNEWTKGHIRACFLVNCPGLETIAPLVSPCVTGSTRAEARLTPSCWRM